MFYTDGTKFLVTDFSMARPSYPPEGFLWNEWVRERDKREKGQYHQRKNSEILSLEAPLFLDDAPRTIPDVGLLLAVKMLKGDGRYKTYNGEISIDSAKGCLIAVPSDFVPPANCIVFDNLIDAYYDLSGLKPMKK
jgi:hypothetical protein